MMKTHLTVGRLAACFLVATTTTVADDLGSASIVTEWNKQVLEIAEAEDGFLTLKGVRTAAMMHIAMHDALAAIERRYLPYTYDRRKKGADPVAAAVHAAYTVAADQYPDKQSELEALRDTWLSRMPEGKARAAGTKLGKAAARAVLADREDDGWNGEAEYQWHPMAPGVYAEFREHSGTPEGFVFGAGWAAARPFALTSQNQFRSPPPPDVASGEYTEAFDEVKDIGRFESDSRTADQTHLALWWKDFAENSHNRLARDLVARERTELVDAARLFALLNLSIYDAYVSVFDNKFFYNHWRPYTAIRWAANDGNPDTQADETWTNLHNHTYAFPTYPSAHGTACAAAMSAIADTFGENYAFSMRTPAVDVAGPFSGKMEMQPSTRRFESPSDAAMECALSRVYLGIHFRYDSIEGNSLGTGIGQYVLANYLRPQQ
jgi:membrane-associated phospholipid phosphatase